MGVDIKSLERLAMLKLGKDEETSIARDVERILEFFRQIDKISLEGVEPLFHVVERGARVRGDEVAPGIDRSWLEASSARFKDGYVVGPRTITGEEQ